MKHQITEPIFLYIKDCVQDITPYNIYRKENIIIIPQDYTIYILIDKINKWLKLVSYGNLQYNFVYDKNGNKTSIIENVKLAYDKCCNMIISFDFDNDANEFIITQNMYGRELLTRHAKTFADLFDVYKYFFPNSIVNLNIPRIWDIYQPKIKNTLFDSNDSPKKRGRPKK